MSLSASGLHREIVERGYQGGLSQLRTFMRSLRPAPPVGPEVRFETVVIEHDVCGDGQHRYHAGFLDFAKPSGCIIKLCQPYRPKTKGKVEPTNN